MDNDVISVEDMIAVVAKKHKILLSEDDPILATMTLNELMLQNYLIRQSKEFEKLKISLASIYIKQEEQAAVVVKTIMDECLKAAKESLEQSAHKASEDIKTALRTQQNLIVDRNKKMGREIINSRNLSLISSMICLASVLFIAVIFFI